MDRSSSRGFLLASEPSIRNRKSLLASAAGVWVRTLARQVVLYLDPEQLFEELRVEVCEQVVGKVQLGQEVQAGEALRIQAVGIKSSRITPGFTGIQGSVLKWT